MNIRPRLARLEAQTAAVEAVALLIYRDHAELEVLRAQATAPVLICIPDNGRNPRGTDGRAPAQAR
jgi:hypothetical protein